MYMYIYICIYIYIRRGRFRSKAIWKGRAAAPVWAKMDTYLVSSNIYIY